MFELGVTTKKRKRVGDIFGGSSGRIRNNVWDSKQRLGFETTSGIRNNVWDSKQRLGSETTSTREYVFESLVNLRQPQRQRYTSLLFSNKEQTP